MARRLAAVSMFLSGFAGMGYQLVWTQQAASMLGHEVAAVMAVVTAFFGGLALGGVVAGPLIERSDSPRRWYVGAELVIAAWSAVLPALWTSLGDAAFRFTGLDASGGRQWGVAFAVTFAALLPATAAMGATLPAMERLVAPTVERRSLSGLYAFNTLGAFFGVVVTVGWSLPLLGLSRTGLVCVAASALCATLAFCAFPAGVVASPPRSAKSAWALSARLLVTGLLGIGYEVVVVRVLSQVTENTVYTFGVLLAVYLLGTAAGAAAYRRWLERSAADAAERLLAALSGACLLGGLSLWEAERVRDAALASSGQHWGFAVAAEALLALLPFGLPTIVMGALFSQLSREAREAGLTFGQALGLNALAGAAAPLVFGVLLVPRAGAKVALLVIALGYWLLLPRRAWSKTVFWVPPAGAALVAGLAPPLRFVDVPDGGRVVSYAEGVTAAVSVVEDSAEVRRLRINNRQQEGSSASLRVDARQAWLPLLFHSGPRRALFLGLGTGVTATSAAADPTLRVDAVELVPEVISASTLFADGEARDRLRVFGADARRFARGSAERYDVIVADNFHPARSGTAALYTVEHFAAVRGRLEPGGLFCQWLPLHQMDLETLRVVVRSFLAVNPDAVGIIASSSLETPVIGLLARAGEARFSLPTTRERLTRSPLREQLSQLGLEDEYAVLGSVIADASALGRYAGAGPLNTDDRPLVAYRAPRVTYAPDSSPASRLLSLLGSVTADPTRVLVTPSASDRQRLAAYWSARSRFIASGQNVVPTAKAEEMLAQVREPLLAALRISPDFRPAYDPLVALAAALARSDAERARALLTELSRVQPARPEALQLLSTLDGIRR